LPSFALLPLPLDDIHSRVEKFKHIEQWERRKMVEECEEKRREERGRG